MRGGGVRGEGVRREGGRISEEDQWRPGPV
jgi:hypothetical protein